MKKLDKTIVWIAAILIPAAALLLLWRVPGPGIEPTAPLPTTTQPTGASTAPQSVSSKVEPWLREVNDALPSTTRFTVISFERKTGPLVEHRYVRIRPTDPKDRQAVESAIRSVYAVLKRQIEAAYPDADFKMVLIWVVEHDPAIAPHQHPICNGFTDAAKIMPAEPRIEWNERTTSRQVAPRVRFGKSEPERQTIYRLLMQAAYEAQSEADARIPVTGIGVEVSKASILANQRLKQELNERKDAAIAQRFGLDKLNREKLDTDEIKAIAFSEKMGDTLPQAILSAIGIEGYEKNWPH